MKFACSTWMMPGDTFLKKLHAAACYGFDGVEVRLFEEDATPETIREIKFGLRETGLTACSLIMPGETYRAPLLDTERMEEKIELSKKALDAAAELGCPTIVCPEYGPQIPLPLFDHPRRPSQGIHYLLIEFLQTVAQYAQKEAGTDAMIEPINRYETRFYYTLDDGAEVIREVGSPNLKLLADIFHMSMEEVSIPDAIRKNGSLIRHFHLGDSNRLMPGQGHTDFRAAFKALHEVGYEGYCALECSTPGEPDAVFPECVRYLKEQARLAKEDLSD